MGQRRHFFKGAGGSLSYVYSPTDFIIEVTVTAGETIVVPFNNSGTYDCVVWFGDGDYAEVTSYNDPLLTHTYADAGTYQLIIVGTCTHFMVQDSADIDTNITKISQWGKSFTRIDFWGCSNVDASTVVDVLDTSNMTVFNRLFSNCTNLVGVNRVDEWNVTPITDMYQCFLNCSNFNGDLSGWDMSTTLDARFMLRDCGSINFNMGAWTPHPQMQIYWAFSDLNSMISANIDVNSWALAPNNSCYRAFQNTTALICDFDLWDMAGATNIGEMFYGCVNFNGNVDNWDVSNSSSCYRTFAACTSFNRNITGWTFKIGATIQNMLSGCTSFTQDISVWDVSNVNWSGLFGSCVNLDIDISSWPIGNTTNMNFMFNNCESFNCDLSSLDVSGISDFSECFQDCDVFNQDLSSWDISNATNMLNFGRGATSLSVANWDAMLIAWASLPTPPSNITIDMYPTHSATSQTAFDTLVNTYGWTINENQI